MLQTTWPVSVGQRVEVIACGIDFTLESDQACAAAGELARYFDSRVLLIHVAEDRSALPRARERLAAYRPTWLDGLPVTSIVTVGDPAHEIGRLTRQNGAGLIVIGAHNHEEPLVPAGMEAGLADVAPCPVLTFRSPAEARATIERLKGLTSERVRCTVCARFVDGLICASCRTRIACEAMQHKWREQLHEGPGLMGLGGARATGPLPFVPVAAAPQIVIGVRPLSAALTQPRRGPARAPRATAIGRLAQLFRWRR